jgi:protoporphyrinogen oxidase
MPAPSRGAVIVAGAGVAGLAAGVAFQKRGYQVTVFERSDRVGGLAGGIELGGNVYEYGPHIFHTTDPEVLDDVTRIAGHVLVPFERTIKIKFLGKYFDFPLAMGDVLTKLPPLTVVHAGLSLAWHAAKGAWRPAPSLRNAETLLVRYYGRVLYRIFFEDYITRVWGIPPRGMAASFARERIPRFDWLDTWERLKARVLGRARGVVPGEGFVERVAGAHFSTPRGFSLIAECYADELRRAGGRLVLGRSVTSVHLDAGKATAVTTDDGVAHPCAHVVSTVPISRLPAMLHPPPAADVLAAAARLRFRAITFVGLLVARAGVLPAAFMYFRDRSFNRITDLARFGVGIEPAGATILIAEITCQPGDPLWDDERAAAAGVVRELVEEGLLREDEVLERHVFKAEHGYPIYAVGYEEDLRATLAGVARAADNVHSIGRQGRFAYVNTHVAMKMGYDLARRVAGE